MPPISFVIENGCVSRHPLNATGYICNCPIQHLEKLDILAEFVGMEVLLL